MITGVRPSLEIEDKVLGEEYVEIAFKFMKLAVPSMLCTIMLFLQHLCNMIVAGHLQDTSMLAGIGMGNMIQNCFFVAPIIGMNAAIETLAS